MSDSLSKIAEEMREWAARLVDYRSGVTMGVSRVAGPCIQWAERIEALGGEHERVHLRRCGRCGQKMIAHHCATPKTAGAPMFTGGDEQATTRVGQPGADDKAPSEPAAPCRHCGGPPDSPAHNPTSVAGYAISPSACPSYEPEER